VTRLIALALAAALAVPCIAAGQAKPKAPSGKFKVVSNGKGSLRVTDKKLVSLTILPQDGDTVCGPERIILTMEHTLTTVSRAGVTNWIVGKPTPQKTDAYQLVKTTLASGRKRLAGKIKMLWHENGKSGIGRVVFGDCGLDFAFQR
jgi:hypothetical protein